MLFEYVLTVRLSSCASDYAREVSSWRLPAPKRVSRVNQTESKYTKADFEDWISRMFKLMLRRFHLGFSGIQTHDLCLVMLVFYQRSNIKAQIPNSKNQYALWGFRSRNNVGIGFQLPWESRHYYDIINFTCVFKKVSLLVI